MLALVRADVTFDWRLVHMPRWVPYDEWQRWQQEGLRPDQRDGPWAEINRGQGATISGRISAITSSCENPEQAFKFLRFLMTNEDFNRALLIEDGMGAHRE